MTNQDFYNKLAELVSAEAILENEPMSKHTTFRIGGNADMFVSPKVSQVADIIKLAKEYDVPVTIIGNGSNLLVGDNGIRGLVLSFGKEAPQIWKGGDPRVYHPAVHRPAGLRHHRRLHHPRQPGQSRGRYGVSAGAGCKSEALGPFPVPAQPHRCRL